MEPTTGQIDNLEFHDALRSVGCAKTWLLLGLLLVLAVQVGVFAFVHFGGVLDEPAVDAATTQPAATAEGDRAEMAVEDDIPPVAPDAQPAETADRETRATLRDAMTWALAGTKFFGVVLALLLVLTVMFSVKLSLLGRIGAPSGFLGAFYWSLILLAVMTPWQAIINSTIACGATFNLDQLERLRETIQAGADGEKPGWLAVVFFYARFIAYPALAMLIALVVAAKFGRGFRPLKHRVMAVPVAPAGQA